MDEAIRQRELVRGQKLLCEAFDVLRAPLEIDDKDGVDRPEVQLALTLVDAKERLYDIIIKRQRAGIRSASEQNA